MCGAWQTHMDKKYVSVHEKEPMKQKQWHTRGSTNKEYERINFWWQLVTANVNIFVCELTIHHSYVVVVPRMMIKIELQASNHKLFIYLFVKCFIYGTTDDGWWSRWNLLENLTSYRIEWTEMWQNKNLFFFLCFVLVSSLLLFFSIL